jgi:hypothetical protein
MEPFRIFSKIRGDIRELLFIAGVNDTGVNDTGVDDCSAVSTPPVKYLLPVS